MSIKTILFASALALSAFAAPVPTECDGTGEGATTKGALTVDQLVKIDPRTKACATGVDFADECRDASVAVPALNKAFETYKITSPAEQAALVAYELFESGGYKYSHNHFPSPGRAGQGTRMMAMPPVVQEYATAIAGADAVTQALAAGGDAGLEAVLALVNSDDEKSFASAAWFITAKCSADVRAGLQSGSEQGWHDFLTQCVETDPKGRDDLWNSAKSVLVGQ